MILNLIGTMIKEFRQTFGQFPERVVIGTGAKRQLENELFDFNMQYPKGPVKSLGEISKDLDENKLRYMGVSIQLDVNEKFVRLESKKC